MGDLLTIFKDNFIAAILATFFAILTIIGIIGTLALVFFSGLMALYYGGVIISVITVVFITILLVSIGLTAVDYFD